MKIARGELRRKNDDPKVWFTSIESLANVLSSDNRELLNTIAETSPESVDDLARMTGRARSNLACALQEMAEYGLVEMEKGDGQKINLKVPGDNITLEIILATPSEADTKHAYDEVKEPIPSRTNLTSRALKDLLGLHVGIGKELKTRGIIRTDNNPVGELAEYLFCQAFGWEISDRSARNVDAIGNDTRYQIKGRKVTEGNPSRQLGYIRDLDDKHFDILAAVIFNEDYSIRRAALVPWEVVSKYATYAERPNAYIFHLRDDIWEISDVKDVTEDIRKVFLDE